MASFNPKDALHSTDGPSIYVGFWGHYNKGSLYGNWIDLEIASTREEIEECIQFLRDADKVSQDGECEEWMVQDHCCLPRCLQGENPDLAKVEEFMDVWHSIHESEQEPWMAYCENNPSTLPDEQEFRNAFKGCYASGADYVEELHEEEGLDHMGELANYIDWQRVWHDFDCSGYWTAAMDDGEVAVFAPV